METCFAIFMKEVNGLQVLMDQANIVVIVMNQLMLIVHNMFHVEFVATVYGVIDIQPLSAKISFTLQFDPSCLVPLDDDAIISRMFRYNNRFFRVYVSTCEEIAGQPTM